jgi:hypothetical protein
MRSSRIMSAAAMAGLMQLFDEPLKMPPVAHHGRPPGKRSKQGPGERKARVTKQYKLKGIRP